MIAHKHLRPRKRYAKNSQSAAERVQKACDAAGVELGRFDRRVFEVT
jgi:hypothetical protein